MRKRYRIYLKQAQIHCRRYTSTVTKLKMRQKYNEDCEIVQLFVWLWVSDLLVGKYTGKL